MDSKWFPPPDRPFQPGGGSIFGAGIIGVTTLLLPQGAFRKTIAIPPILWILYNMRQHTTGKPEEDYLTAINVSMALARFLDVCVLRDAEKEFRRVNTDESARETPNEIKKMTLWQKLRWNLDLFTTMRGIGWNWRVKNVDEVPLDTSRSAFVLEQILRASYCFAFLDIDEWYMRRTPFGDRTAPLPDFFSLPLLQQVFLGWESGLRSGMSMVLGYYLLSAVVVGTGIHSPQSWPPMFGSFLTKGYTMRNIWGYCWHQILRRVFETANSSLTRLMRIRKGTLTSRYFQLYNAFFVSALIHHIGSLNCPYSVMVWYQFYFFMIQPVAITVEDFAIYLGKKMGLQDNWKTRVPRDMWLLG
ncbi:hypothetical protein H2200_007803 [Cladophialophora chaetospira]|uniref:Wax synthase domain-containing protein n=1 Tax=Cladophialophora chaetospira TaxID=386627 RepID=A0AA38X6F6_9EURO|nr:hypothetical protein H2200_007803 [Cladophialophora chaetospira]